MSEAQEIAEEFELTEDQLAEAEQEEQEEQDGKPEPEAPKGFISKEAWIESGKPAEDWVSPEVFKERTLRIQSESRLKRELKQREEDFDNRLKNLNAYSQAQLKRQREELLSKRDEYIEVADKAGVKKIDKELEDLNAHADLVKDEPKQQIQKPPEVVEWEEENAWCMDLNDPRLPIAQKAYTDAIAAKKTIAGALRAADKAVAAYKPEGKEAGKTAKTPIQMSDTSRSIGRNDSPTLSWKDLKADEVTMFEEFFESTGMSKKDYLKTVADNRRGA